MRPTTTARTLTVLPPSARAETWMVARAVFHIVYWSALMVSAQTYLPGAKAAASAPSPFERRFQDLDARDQRLFRALREGVAEAERRRSATGLWPSADALASAGVPPFAPDPIDRARHVWTFAKAGTTLNYLGTPTSGETFLVLVVEPDPGTPVDPQALVDDVHHRLDDGTMIHVTVWMGPGLGTSREVVTVPPPEQGWKQITVGAGG